MTAACSRVATDARLSPRDGDGSDPVHLLAEGFADDLSPDAKTVVATTDSGRKLVLVPTGAGDQKVLPNHGIVNYSGARWFPDGSRVLFTGVKDPKAGSRSYVQNVNDGSPPQPITTEHTRALAISPKGDMMAVIGTGQAISLQPVEGGSRT
jgi:hypothetical protein